mmetsp:Transcript_76900/g.178356  ORF Transcript_76900/g.178356 Transcript_76900/m.178356 type:complete len:216 (+) Transcript_76900:74-721(+)
MKPSCVKANSASARLLPSVFSMLFCSPLSTQLTIGSSALPSMLSILPQKGPSSGLQSQHTAPTLANSPKPKGPSLGSSTSRWWLAPMASSRSRFFNLLEPSSTALPSWAANPVTASSRGLPEDALSLEWKTTSHVFAVSVFGKRLLHSGTTAPPCMAKGVSGHVGLALSSASMTALISAQSCNVLRGSGTSNEPFLMILSEGSPFTPCKGKQRFL